MKEKEGKEQWGDKTGRKEKRIQKGSERENGGKVEGRGDSGGGGGGGDNEDGGDVYFVVMKVVVMIK